MRTLKTPNSTHDEKICAPRYTMSYHHDLLNDNLPDAVFKLWKKEGVKTMSRPPSFAMNILERCVCYEMRTLAYREPYIITQVRRTQSLDRESQPP